VAEGEDKHGASKPTNIVRFNRSAFIDDGAEGEENVNAYKRTQEHEAPRQDRRLNGDRGDEQPHKPQQNDDRTDYLMIDGRKVKRKNTRRESRASVALTEELHRRLEYYKYVDARPIKDMINEAVAEWLDRRTQQDEEG
jgi:hypothetical protein